MSQRRALDLIQALRRNLAGNMSIAHAVNGVCEEGIDSKLQKIAAELIDDRQPKVVGRKFHPLTALDIIRSISDLEIIEHPYDAINVAKVHERLQKNGYDANEVQDVIWALRERASGPNRNGELLTRHFAAIGDKPLTHYEREILEEKEPQ